MQMMEYICEKKLEKHEIGTMILVKIILGLSLQSIMKVNFIFIGEIYYNKQMA